MSTGGALVGVDSGGTFTDLVRLDDETGEMTVVKVPSTPARPIDAVRTAVAQSVGGGGFARLVHGTTVATNAILERRGARLCLLTTAGFEDVPVIQRINRRYAFDLGWQKPTPLVPRRRTVGVRERIGPNGIVHQPLDDEECARAVTAVEALVEQGEVEAVAVCLLFSFANAEHELALERELAARLPELPVSLSSRVSPLWREYERVSTTLADAYVRPLMASYLDDLVDGVAPVDEGGPVLMLKSNGGTGSPGSVAPAPVTTILSGLAGGALGGAHFAAAAGEPRCVTLDIGGTSTDIGLVHDGSVRQRSEFEIEWGLPVVTPTVDVHAVGAGGGSIAHVDAGGFLRVGPRERRRGAGAGGVRARRHGGDGDGREPRARPAEPGVLPGRPHAARHGRRGGRRRARRRGGRPRRDGSRARRRADRDRERRQRRAAADDRARNRPARLRADRLRRRRARSTPAVSPTRSVSRA